MFEFEPEATPGAEDELGPRIRSLACARLQLVDELARIARQAQRARRLELRRADELRREGRATLDVLEALDAELVELLAGGTAEEQAKRRQNAQALLDRPIT